MTWITEYRRQRIPLWQRVIERAIAFAFVAGSVYLAVVLVAAAITAL